MKATKCYKTSDDKIHEDKAQARRRQAELDLYQRFASGTGRLIDDVTPDNFALFALSCKEQFMELFRSEDALKQKPA